MRVDRGSGIQGADVKKSGVRLNDLGRELRDSVRTQREYQEWIEPSDDEIIRDEDVDIICGEIVIANQSKLERVQALLAGIPEKPGQSLQETIEEFMESKGIVKNSEVYSRSNIDRKLFSAIMTSDRIPKKTNLFALCFGLQLNRTEAGKLLAIAGYLFSKSLRFDMYVEQMILRKVYSIYEVNEILRDAQLPELGSREK